ncbi:isochorismate synthase [Gordonia sp. PP30]|uniref:isochorismate synthase n=1 Tax=Gordonia sp. PP30 TaxID=2935861 RepID=UPI001FFE3D28|nr:isochorismate synthase [Gordonia sp. PP30]UQE75512.1 isochorismate synthase [Gordonia sp. PP30]
MTGTTSFVLSRPSGTVRGTGVAARFASVAAARSALGGDAAVIAGLLAFDTAAPAALLAPERWSFRPEPLAPRPPAAVVPADSSLTPPGVHRERVEAALRIIGAGGAEKIVLAREATLRFAAPVDPDALTAAFADGAGQSAVFAAQTAGGGWLIGASPELLVRRSGRVVTCHPLAGSAARQHDPDLDAAAAASLAASDKDLREHAFVVDDIAARLAPLCEDLDVPAVPVLSSTPEMWHLATPIRGILRDDPPRRDTATALDLAALLSPTPAVCGTPRAAAAAAIAEIEGPREFYGGAVGWCDARGDGEWLVSIRCVQIDPGHRVARTWAGGGIVAGSDPAAEVAETDAKFRTAFRALGIDPR